MAYHSTNYFIHVWVCHTLQTVISSVCNSIGCKLGNVITPPPSLLHYQ